MPLRKHLFSTFSIKLIFFIAFIENFDDAMNEMPDHFLMGTVRGSFTNKILKLSENIIKPVLNLQLRVPIINEKNIIESAVESADDTERKIGLIDFSRPSDYRIKAIEAKSAAINVGDDDTSHLSGTSRLSTVATSIESLKTGNTPYEGKMPIN